MRSIDLDTLEIFQSVVACGGISHAARTLHRVPSNITTRIKQLEARLGVALFHRQGRGLRLTQEGEVLLGYAERLLRLATEAEATLKTRRPQGTFRLGSLESAAGARLPPILSRYHQDNPSVRVELLTAPTSALVSHLLNHDIEAAVVSQPFTAPGLERQALFEEELVLISARGRAPVRSARDLGRTTLIAFAHGCSYRKRLEDWLATDAILPERVLEFASYPAIVACVAAGSGVALVPRSVLASLRATDDVMTHALPAALARNVTHLLWHPGTPSIAFARFRALLPTLDAVPAGG